MIWQLEKLGLRSKLNTLGTGTWQVKYKKCLCVN